MGWLIAAAILLVIFALLACSVAVRFEYDKNGDIKLKISYLCFTIYTIPAKEKKKKKAKTKHGKKSEQPAATASEKAADESAETEASHTAPAAEGTAQSKGSAKKSAKTAKPKKKLKLTLDDIFALVRLATDSLIKPLKKLFKRIRIYDFCLYITCGGDDAAEAALNYGKTNVAVGAALGNLDTFFTLKPYDVDIGVDFQSEESVSECSCTIKLSLLAALAFAFTLVFRLLRHLKKDPRSERAVRKLASK